MRKNKLLILLSLFIPCVFISNGYLTSTSANQNEALPITMNLRNNEAMEASINENGKYEVPLTLDLVMGADAFSKTAIVEKLDEHYYMTFTQADSSNLKDMKLITEGKHGEIIRENGIEKSYTYTVSKDDLTKPFKFSVIVTVMNKLVDFEMTLNLNEATFKESQIDNLGERPALYIPEIKANLSDIELEKGSTYILPDAKAILKDEEIEVDKKVFFNNQEVLIDNNKVTLLSIGEYNVVYSASSDKYKTSMGKNTSSTISFKIVSKIGVSVLGKLEDKNNILAAGSQLQTALLTNGSSYELAKEQMKKIADNYQVFDLTLYSKEGNTVELNDCVSIYIRVDDYFNRNEIELYHMDENGNLKSVEFENYGRYIKFDTMEMGTYIALVPGVQFIMPIWGYALIGVAVVLVIVAIIVTSILLKIKHKK